MKYSDSHPHSHFRGSEFATVRWVAKRLARLTPLRRANPFSRLDFYVVSHGLAYKLRLYQGGNRAPMFRGASWGTLRYWSLLLDDDLEGVASAEDVVYDLSR